MLTNKDLGETIGGFPIAVEATAERHRYLGFSGHYTYKFPPLVGAVTVQPIEQIYTGDGHFGFYVTPSTATDVPVVGVCLLQARTGYVYSPILQPEAIPVELIGPQVDWEGQEQTMFNVLNDAVAHHVEKVALV